MKNNWKFTLEEDKIFEITHDYKDYEGKNVIISKDIILIKKGFSWDGVTIAKDTDSTYDASCLHDALYGENADCEISRKQTDIYFYAILRLNQFDCAKLYFKFVRVFGFLYWRNHIVVRITRFVTFKRRS